VSAPADNSQQIAYWNEQAGPRWVRFQERLDAQLRPLGRAVLDAAGLTRGTRVLDVGCGCGDSSLEAVARVAPDGSVTGVDISAPMLARARERARQAGVAAASFLEADAQAHAFAPGSFDVAISRFGVMFFHSPEAAFANLYAALAPRGRLTFVCWQALSRNLWMSAPLAALARHVPLPPPPDPCAPGPFAFADAERVRAILAAAGFASVAVDALEGDLSLGGARSPEEGAAFIVEIGPAAHALREAGADEALRARVVDAAAEALAPFARDGAVRAPYAAWLVSCARP
jgi:SAM-dependent methyltransferase